MAVSNIERPLTTEEKKDMSEVGRITPEKKFRKKLIAEEQKYAKLHEPFCYHCARLDYKNLIDAAIKEMEQHVGYVNVEENEVFQQLKVQDFAQYSDKKRFHLESTQDAMDNIILPGQLKATMTKIGVHENFICKRRGCGVSVFIPIDLNTIAAQAMKPVEPEEKTTEDT